MFLCFAGLFARLHFSSQLLPPQPHLKQRAKGKGKGKGKGKEKGEGKGANMKHHLSLPDSGGLMLLLHIRLLAFLLTLSLPLYPILGQVRKSQDFNQGCCQQAKTACHVFTACKYLQHVNRPRLHVMFSQHASICNMSTGQDCMSCFHSMQVFATTPLIEILTI
jgi:hypothetical protein